MVQLSSNYRFIGRGVYSLADASRLTGVPVRRLQRWAQGYEFKYRGTTRTSPPILGSGLTARSGEPILEFLDIIEARFLAAFRKAGVSWPVIRSVAAKVAVELKQSHPFTTRLFRSDGRTILLEEVAYDRAEHRFVDLLRDQYEWERMISACLIHERVEFDDLEKPARWWPLGTDRRVVVDPERAFGAPIVAKEGVQTYLLAKAVAVENDVDFVSNWYHVERAGVEDAVEFENSLTQSP